MSGPAEFVHGQGASVLRATDRVRAVADLSLGTVRTDPVLAALLVDVAASLALPIAAVNIVLDGAAQLVASVGVDGWVAEVGGVPIEWSFCRHTVASGAPVVIADAACDPRERDNPLVAGEGIRSYVGVPLFSPDRHAVGALCAVGTEPRAFDAADVAYLERLAPVVVHQLLPRVA